MSLITIKLQLIFALIDLDFFLRSLGTSSHSVSGTGETSRSNSGTANSESAAARAGACRETSPSGAASAGIYFIS